MWRVGELKVKRAELWELFRQLYLDNRYLGLPAVIAFAQAKMDFYRLYAPSYGVLFGGM